MDEKKEEKPTSEVAKPADEKPKDASSDEGVSLDSTESQLESDKKVATEKAADSAAKAKAQAGIGNKARGLITHLNIYFLMFILIVVVSAGVVLVSIQRNKKTNAPTTISTQPLTQETIDKLKGSEAKVGDPKQTLTIESNAIFSGKVLIRDSLDVAGTIKVGSTLSLPGLSVSGTSTFDQVLSNKLSVSGDATVQGQLNVQKNLVTSGGATFGGAVSAPTFTVQTLQLGGDLQITRHIDAGGGNPSKSDGSALGNGGTASLSGSDTAGTITINTGGSPSAGCFVTITFAIKYGGTPHVAIGPIGSAAAGLSYYVNRGNTGFSVCTTNAAPAGQTFGFDYIVFE